MSHYLSLRPLRRSIIYPLVVCAALLVAGVASAAWTGPCGASPSNCNATGPLDQSATAQIKQGGLTVAAGGGITTGLVVVNGNVGLGTASPSSAVKLQVGDGTGSGLSRFFTDASDIYIGRNTGATFGFSPGTTAFVVQDATKAFPLSIGTIGSQPLVFGTANTERARISSGGFLGVGVTNPQVKLDVSGPNVGYGGQVRISAPDYAQIVFYSTADMTLSNPARKAYIYYDVAAGTFHINNGTGGSINFSGGTVNANGSPVCTPANGLCGGSSAVTSVNGMTGAVTGLCQSNGANCPSGGSAGWQFGGMYTWSNAYGCSNGGTANPLTGGCNCPAGFAAGVVGGYTTPSGTATLFMCYK